jgi:hypothetical protein
MRTGQFNYVGGRKVLYYIRKGGMSVGIEGLARHITFQIDNETSWLSM